MSDIFAFFENVSVSHSFICIFSQTVLAYCGLTKAMRWRNCFGSFGFRSFGLSSLMMSKLGPKMYCDFETKNFCKTKTERTKNFRIIQKFQSFCYFTIFLNFGQKVVRTCPKLKNYDYQKTVLPRSGFEIINFLYQRDQKFCHLRNFQIFSKVLVNTEKKHVRNCLFIWMFETV